MSYNSYRHYRAHLYATRRAKYHKPTKGIISLTQLLYLLAIPVFLFGQFIVVAIVNRVFDVIEKIIWFVFDL